MSSVRLQTYYPPWNTPHAALELRTQFLRQAFIARYLEARVVNSGPNGTEVYEQASLAADRLSRIASQAEERGYGLLAASLAGFAEEQRAALELDWEVEQGVQSCRMD